MLGSRKVTTLGGDKFKDEYSLAFDGTDDYIATTLNGNTFDGDFTISAWVKNESEDIYHSIFSHYQDSDNYMNFYIPKSSVTSANKIGFHGKVGGTNYYVTGVTQIFATNDWVHVVFTQDDGYNGQFMYVNSVVDQDERRDFAMDYAGTSYIGKLSPSSSHIHQGNISEIAIYNTALSASQVKTIYNGREPYNHKEGIASSNLTHWYRMGDGTFDQKSTDDVEGGIVTDMVNPTLGTDVLGGKGDFSDPSYWAISTGESIVESGVGKWLGAGSYGHIKKAGILTANQIYRIDLDVNSHNGSSTNSIALNFSSPYIRIHTAGQTGHFTTYFKAGNTDLTMYQSADYDVVAEIDNVVVRPVNGNPGTLLNMIASDFKGDTP